MLLYLDCFTVVWEALRVLFEKLHLFCLSLLQLTQQLFLHPYARFTVDRLLLWLLCFCLGFGLFLISLVLLKLFPLLFFLLFPDEISLYSLLMISLVFLHEFLVLFLLLLGSVEELAVLAFSAEPCFCPELAGLFGLLLVDEGTVFLDTFAPGVISADFASVLSFHG